MRFENTYTQLPEHFYARVHPARVPAPELAQLNIPLCEELGLDSQWLRSDAGVAMLAGNQLPESADPIAMAYAGHQFGGFSPQLGDGRAILLGEQLDRHGVRRDFQLKGSGRTPFSRGGDGKATLGSVLREYIVSEAMAAFGVPTTRALSVVTSGETIMRNVPQPAAILTRVAQSHVRVGTFQFFNARQDIEGITRLADYVLARHFPELAHSKNPYLSLFETICLRQAELIARWMQLGFIHGVMNTDNTQIVGETIDFGPCAFMDEFHPKCVFSSIDHQGRYAWNNQPVIGQWNLTRLGETFLPILDANQEQASTCITSAIESYTTHFNHCFFSGFRAKFGLLGTSDDALIADQELIRTAFATMAEHNIDFTLFFRNLTKVADGHSDTVVTELFHTPSAGQHFLVQWRQRLAQRETQNTDQAEEMKRVNPIYIPRNHRIEEAIQSAQTGDFSPFKRLTSVLATPYHEQAEREDYERAPTSSQKVHETYCGT